MLLDSYYTCSLVTNDLNNCQSHSGIMKMDHPTACNYEMDTIYLMEACLFNITSFVEPFDQKWSISLKNLLYNLNIDKGQ